MWDYLNNMGQGSNKISMRVTYQTSARVLTGSEEEGRIWHHHRNTIPVIYTVLPNKARGEDTKGLELPPASPETARLSKHLTHGLMPTFHVVADIYSWLFLITKQHYKKLINVILFGYYET